MEEFYDLDLETIQTNIKAFFQASTEFQDYNFDGAALTQLGNTLGYVTQYLAFYLNQTVNELTLGNAEIRSRILELSNMLNYLPNRKSMPYIDVTIQRTESVTIIIPKYSEWKIGNIYLVNLDDITINSGASQNIRLYEGIYTIEYFTSDGSDFQEYTLAECEDIDNNTLQVYVDVPDGTGGYTLDTVGWTNVNTSAFTANSNSHYLSYKDEIKIKFDNGQLFNKPAEDDRIRVSYIVTNGALYNGSTGTITCTDTAVLNNDKLTITPTTTLLNGTDEESSDAIKVRAPLYYTTQSRAITEDDFINLFMKWSKYSLLHSANCWGGEKEWMLSDEIVESSYEKDLGHVYITAIMSDWSYLTSTEKTEAIDFFDPYKIITIFMKFMDPVFVNIVPTVNIKYNTVISLDLTAIETEINEYLETLNGFNKTFYLSEIISYIQDLNNVTYTYITYTSSVTVKHESHKVIRLNNAVVAGSLSGTINGAAISDSGTGIVIWNGSNIGSINNTTGFITLDTTFSGLAEGTEYSFNFVYSDLQTFSLIKESFLKFSTITLNTL